MTKSRVFPGDMVQVQPYDDYTTHCKEVLSKKVTLFICVHTTIFRFACIKVLW